MARIRTVKPELAAHEGLFDLEQETGLPIRFAWVMLFTVCDREGRFVWRPRTLKAQILPHDEIDFSRVLDAWLTRGFIVKYSARDEWYGCIPTFGRHQVINNRESASEIPAYSERDQEDTPNAPPAETRVIDACATREVHAQAEGRKGRKEREGNIRNARASETVPRGTHRLISKIRDLYPPGLYRDTDWSLAEREIAKRLDEGEKLDELTAAAAEYGMQQQAKGSSGTQFVLSPAKFFDATGRWRGPFPLPIAKPGADPAALAAWDALIATDGAKRDARAQSALEAIGGWPVIKSRTAFDENTLRTKFCRAYADARAAA